MNSAMCLPGGGGGNLRVPRRCPDSRETPGKSTRRRNTGPVCPIVRDENGDERQVGTDVRRWGMQMGNSRLSRGPPGGYRVPADAEISVRHGSCHSRETVFSDTTRDGGSPPFLHGFLPAFTFSRAPLTAHSLSSV